jgi:hypothetical protein
MPGIARWIVGGAFALFALDRLLLWMEARGWICWRIVKIEEWRRRRLHRLRLDRAAPAPSRPDAGDGPAKVKTSLIERSPAPLAEDRIRTGDQERRSGWRMKF